MSTSLMILEPTNRPISSNASLVSSFVLSNPGFSDSTFGGNLAARFYGIVSGGLQFSPTTSSNLSIEHFFRNETQPGVVSYSATALGMSASLSCEPIPLQNKTYPSTYPMDQWLVAYATDIEMPNCTIKGVPVGLGMDTDATGPNAGGAKTVATFSYQGFWGNFTCNDNVTNYKYPNFGNGSGIAPSRPTVPGFNDHRMIFIASDVRWPPGIEGRALRNLTWVQSYTAIMCKPSYSIDEYLVTYRSQQPDLAEPFEAVKQKATSRKVDGLTDDDLSFLLYSALTNANLPHRTASTDGVVSKSISYNMKNQQTDDGFFTFMSLMNGESDIYSLLNQSALLEAAPKAFSGIMVQAFSDHFTETVNRSITQEVLVTENRLVLQTLSVALVITCLVLMAQISSFLFSALPTDTAPLDPQTLSSQAKLLASSEPLRRVLHGLNALRLGDMKKDLSHAKYYTHTDHVDSRYEFIIGQETTTEDRAEQPDSVQRDQSAWWTPISNQMWFMAALVLSCLSVIAILEVLQHISNSKDGLVTFQGWGSMHTLITSIPALVMSGIALMFATVNFDTATVAPFTAMKHRPVPSKRGLNTALLGRPSVHAFYLAIKDSTIQPVLTIAAIMIGSFLTIVVSGLYYVDDVPMVTAATLLQTDNFNYTQRDLSQGADNFAASVTSLIYNENSTYPYGTYEHLVFPHYELSDHNSGNISANTISIQLPAVRPNLDCIKIDSASIHVYNVQDFNDSGAFFQMNANVTLPCFTNSDGTGDIIDCHHPWAQDANLVGNKIDEVISQVYSTNPTCVCYGYSLAGNLTQKRPLRDGCPSFEYYIGTTTTERTFESTSDGNFSDLTVSSLDLNAFLCYQNLERIDTDVTLDLPGLTLNSSMPPRPLEETAQIMNVTYGNYTGPHFCSSMTSFIIGLSKMDGYDNGSFFDNLFDGKAHYKPQDFLGKQGIPALTGAMNDLYATYMAQAINSNYRYDLNSTQPATTAPTFTGRMTNPYRQRLKQQADIKLALQVMLASMLACILIVFIFTDREPFLPYNPCSIAGSMILLAGSDMASRKLVPPGSEWSNSNRLWNGYFFSLGWWGTQENPRYGIDVGKAEKSRWDLPKGDGTVNPRDGPGPGAGGGIVTYNPTQKNMNIGANEQGRYRDGDNSDYNLKKGPNVEYYEMSMFDNSENGTSASDGRGRVSIDVGDVTRRPGYLYSGYSYDSGPQQHQPQQYEQQHEHERSRFGWE